MLAWTKQIKTEDNADSRIIIGGHKVMQEATLININLNDMNHNRRTALERLVIITGGLKLVLRAQPHLP